jgi:type IV secretory pathway TraG/TraD family ATPase VirD4
LSDATFWNVARSSGLVGIFATQTIAALEQALGSEAAANFLQQARSKIFFRSEDRSTVEYACWCAGEYERDRVYEDGLFESIDFKELLTGQNYLVPTAISSSAWH